MAFKKNESTGKWGGIAAPLGALGSGFFVYASCKAAQSLYPSFLQKLPEGLTNAVYPLGGLVVFASALPNISGVFSCTSFFLASLALTSKTGPTTIIISSILINLTSAVLHALDEIEAEKTKRS
ncbi:MAG: hypothetical protein K0R73_1406 [Candidatus Midichloriaceae bacterium]|jgi:hypothetical protein|nr:hypothetical protein [Candidatus Midichloriaceae bacterium]